MGKKRKGLWVGGPLVAAVALFAVAAFFVGYNDTDARIERAVAQIADEYGFEPTGQMPGHILPGGIGPALRGKVFSRAPVSEKAADEIVAMLREACPSCKYQRRAYDNEMPPVLISGGDPWKEVHKFFQEEQAGGWIPRVVFIPNNKGPVPTIRPWASITVFKADRPGLWQRIKELWPW